MQLQSESESSLESCPNLPERHPVVALDRVDFFSESISSVSLGGDPGNNALGKVDLSPAGSPTREAKCSGEDEIREASDHASYMM
jgi:hypothetical protein